MDLQKYNQKSKNIGGQLNLNKNNNKRKENTTLV